MSFCRQFVELRDVLRQFCLPRQIQYLINKSNSQTNSHTIITLIILTVVAVIKKEAYTLFTLWTFHWNKLLTFC